MFTASLAKWRSQYGLYMKTIKWVHDIIRFQGLRNEGVLQFEGIWCIKINFKPFRKAIAYKISLGNYIKVSPVVGGTGKLRNQSWKHHNQLDSQDKQIYFDARLLTNDM